MTKGLIEMFLACLTAFVGFFMLIGGAEFLVRGSVVVANKLKVPTRANEVVEDCDGCCANCQKCKHNKEA